MALRHLWSNYRVLIVIGTSLGLIHLGWFRMRQNPLLHNHTPASVPPPTHTAPAKTK